MAKTKIKEIPKPIFKEYCKKFPAEHGGAGFHVLPEKSFWELLNVHLDEPYDVENMNKLEKWRLLKRGYKMFNHYFKPDIEVPNYGPDGKPGVVVLASGSFDPLHIGHIAYLKAAKKLGDMLVVAIKGNDRLKEKKKRHFMNEEERKNILESLKYVDKVVIIDSAKGGLIAPEAIRYFKPDIYACGESEMPAAAKICEELGVEIRYNVGGSRIRSSTELLEAYNKTPWEE